MTIKGETAQQLTPTINK